jgi:hypothetical protein
VLGLLGLPNDTTMETRSFPKIESRLLSKLQKLTKDILTENLIEEAKLSFDVNDNQDENDFQQWKQALSKEVAMVRGKAKYARINCSFDMGWQQRSSGNRYASPSGDALLIGCRTRKPIAMLVKSKICNICKNWEIKRKLDDDLAIEAPPHGMHKESQWDIQLNGTSGLSRNGSGLVQQQALYCGQYLLG